MSMRFRLMRVRNTGLRLRVRLFHLWYLVRRPLTFGVRAVVHDQKANSVFLVHHTYIPRWQLPGGGVEVGETALEAMARDLAEEGNIELAGPPILKSIHLNRHASRRDHVAIYLVEKYRQTAPKLPDSEISDAGFFALDALPDTVTNGTRQRLAEIFDGVEPASNW